MGQAVHVIKNPSGGWSVRLEGTEEASSDHATQQEAIVEGRRLAREAQSRLVIHTKNGQVRDSFSYGGVPRRYTL